MPPFSRQMSAEIREVLLPVALYCGIPAVNEAHRIACDVINERGEQ